MPRDGKKDEQDVARRAYEIYEARGATDGADLDDWLQAERELSGVGISNRESAQKEEHDRMEFPPLDADLDSPDDAAVSGTQLDAQSSHKKGSRSGAQKSAASQYTERTMPAASRVSGAFGREKD
jgi:hypothetical protein